MHEIVQKGMSGGLMGAACGAVLSVAVALANGFLYEKERPVRYRDSRGNKCLFRNLAALDRYGLEAAIKVLYKYRRCARRSFDGAATHTQRLVDLWMRFREDRKINKDGAAFIGKFLASAMKADAHWRDLYGSITDAIGLEEARSVVMGLHESFEAILNDMRSEFGMDHQLPSLAPP